MAEQFKISKILTDQFGTAPPGDENHVYHGLNIERTDWYHHSLTTEDTLGASVKKLAIFSTVIDESAGVYFPVATASWSTDRHLAKIVARTGGDGLAAANYTFDGSQGMGRTIVITSDFELEWNNGLGTYELGISGTFSSGLTSFTSQLVGNAQTIFDITNEANDVTPNWGNNSVTIDSTNDDFGFRLQEQSGRKALLTQRSFVGQSEPTYADFKPGYMDAGPSSNSDERGYIRFEGLQAADPELTGIGSEIEIIINDIPGGANWSKTAYMEARHFTRFQYTTGVSTYDGIELTALLPHMGFFGPRSAISLVPESPIARKLEAGLSKTTISLGEEGDIHFESAAQNVAPHPIAARVLGAPGATDAQGKQLNLDGNIFEVVTNGTGATNLFEDYIGIKAGVLGNVYQAGVGMALGAKGATAPGGGTFAEDTFTFYDNAGTPAPIASGTKLAGIQYNDNNISIAYDSAYFFIDNEELSLKAAVFESDWKESVRAATTGPITLSGLQTIDGVVLVAGDRVLVKNQSGAPADPANGIYDVVDGASWTRSSDAIQDALTSGATTNVEEGTDNINDIYRLVTDDPITVGGTPLQWVRIAVSSVTAGAGIRVNGNNIEYFDGATVMTSGMSRNGILFEDDIISVTTDTPWVTFNGQDVTLADIPAVSVRAGDINGEKQNFTSTLANAVLKTNVTNTDLEWGLITGSNVTNNTLTFNKIQQIDGYTWVGKPNTGTGDMTDTVMTPNGVIGRSDAGNIRDFTLINSLDFVGNWSGAAAITTVNKFSSVNFAYNGTTLEVIWQGTDW